MRISREGQIDVFKNLVEHRPWGHFGLYASNEPCTVKILFVKQGEALSLQVHRHRAQLYYCIDGGFEIQYSVHQVPLETMDSIDAVREYAKHDLIECLSNEGDMFGFRRRVIHRARYIGPRKIGRIFEIAYGHNDEEDIIRIEDDYDR